MFLAGFCLCIYPVVGSALFGRNQKDKIQTYEKAVEEISKEELDMELEQAVFYNQQLFQTQGRLLSDSDRRGLSSERYEELLNLWQTGMMCSIEIPKISVYLPVYHGTDETVLSAGIGHLEGSSLPVGGENTRCVLAGHRGLPSAKLFTRLDELEVSDLFYIHTLDQVLAYQITEIEVLKPEETDALRIVPEKDLVSLVTCTPYGINTHRLVVTGERVAYEQITYEKQEPKIPSIRELGFVIVPLTALFLWVGLIKKRKRKKVDGNKKSKVY